MSSLSSVGTGGALSSPSAASSTGTLSVGGLVSGLNTSQLIQGLLAVQQSQITTVQARQAAVTQREGAYKALEAQLLNLQASARQLAQPVNGPFDGHTATSSDSTVLTAAASSSAAAGTYSLTVTGLAHANQVASQNFDSTSSKITHGTLTVGSGSATATITIDGTNDTLQGLASAISAANAGVSATVINDGSSHPYRLLLTANNTGLANAVTFDPSGLAPDDATSGAVRPTITDTVQAATDASVTLGSGGGAVTVTSASNTINNVIADVTLNLVAASLSKPVQIAVAGDTSTAQKAVQDFVTAYNSVISTIAADVQYDPQSNTAACCWATHPSSASRTSCGTWRPASCPGPTRSSAASAPLASPVTPAGSCKSTAVSSTRCCPARSAASRWPTCAGCSPRRGSPPTPA
jgi:flagellar hook-associated protein 2